jgi:dipeptidyl aminopeptidase/acylaminoacyl peptidase
MTQPPIIELNKIGLDSHFSSVSDNSIIDKIDIFLGKNNYYELTYNSNGRKVKGFIGEPKEANETTPVVIFNRGGTKEYGAFSPLTFTTSFLITRMIDWGYIVIATQYSGNGGSEGKDEFGGMDLDDVLNLQPVIEAYSKGNLSKIAMVGGSRGASMTYLALSQIDWVKAAVVEAGLTNHARNLQLREDMREQCKNMFDISNYEIVRERSPITHAHKINKNTPLLIMHGTADEKVSPLDSLEMATKLQECGHTNYQLVMFAGDNHKLSNNRINEEAMLRNWLDKHLITKK